VDDSVGQDGIWLGTKNIEQSHLALGIRIFGRHDMRRYPLKLLSVILGENMSSRLFQIVREKHGMAYSVHSGMHLYDDTGALLITAGLDRERLVPASKLIVKELQRIKDRPVSKKELQRAKDYSAGQLKIGLEGTSSQMIWVGEHLMCFGYVRQPQEIIERLNMVTVEDISKIANDVLKYDRSSISVLVPEGNKIEGRALQDIFATLN
jgi:predicted Zn-dependent peptidase